MSTRKKPNKTKTVRCPQCGTELLEVTDRIRQLKEAAFKLRQELKEFTETDWDQERIDHEVFLKAEDRESGFVDCSKCGCGYHISGRQGALEGEHVCPRCRREQETQALKDRIVELEAALQEAQQAAESYEELYAGELYRKGEAELNFTQERADALRRTMGAKGGSGGISLNIGRQMLEDRDTLLHRLGQAQDDIKDLQAKMANSKFNAEEGAKARERLMRAIRSAPCPNNDDGCQLMSNPVCCKQYGKDDHDCWKLKALKSDEEL
jgi:uncharacterized Zn-finger protein